MGDKLIDKERLLVDVCCGPCSIPISELYNNITNYAEKNQPQKISNQNYDVIFYVTNSNVHPFSEYVKRLQSIRQVAKHYKNSIILDNYNPKEWLSLMTGLENEPEGQKRCMSYYRYRLEKTAQYASTHGYKSFTTTLTTGPSKESAIINTIGKELAGKYNISFIELDLKKNGGFMKSVIISKKLGLYRQNYCGCIFSLNNPKHKRASKAQKSSIKLGNNGTNHALNISIASPKL